MVMTNELPAVRTAAKFGEHVVNMLRERGVGVNLVNHRVAMLAHFGTLADAVLRKDADVVKVTIGRLCYDLVADAMLIGCDGNDILDSIYPTNLYSAIPANDRAVAMVNNAARILWRRMMPGEIGSHYVEMADAVDAMVINFATGDLAGIAKCYDATLDECCALVWDEYNWSDELQVGG